jgi:site-specific DNA recombinase
MTEFPTPALLTAKDLARLDAMLIDRRPRVHHPRSLRFAFYGRVSTDDQRGLQDATVSRAWQHEAALRLIEGHGEIVAEYFDEGVSRTIPMFRRAAGSELLSLLETGTHDLHAIVVGEAKRVFASSQLEDVQYVLARAGVELWIPELGGRYDDSNLSHRMMLAFEGIIGKNESDTVRRRVRESMRSIAKSADRRWLGGTPPYGYRLVPLDGSASRWASLASSSTLELDPLIAPVACRIFDDCLAGRGLREIARSLEDEGVPSPSGGTRWHTSTLSSLLDNHTYTGVRVYGKQQKVQVLFDENNPRLGTVTKRTRETERPVRSSEVLYPPIISIDEFSRAVEVRTSRRSLTTPRVRVGAGKERLPLQGRVFCEGNRMSLDRTRHGRIRYRLRDTANGQHRAIYDDSIRRVLDPWLDEVIADQGSRDDDSERLRLFDRIDLRVDYLADEQAIDVTVAHPRDSDPQQESQQPHGHEGGRKARAPGGTRTPNPFLRTELLFH